MSNMNKSPRRGSGIDVPLIIFWGIILVGVILFGSSCSVPAGAGPEEPEKCEWELEKRSVSHSLTDVSLTITGAQLVSASKPRPPAPIKVRPAPPKAPSMNKVKPGKTPAKMPEVNKPSKTPQPPYKAPKGKYWEYDCD